VWLRASNIGEETCGAVKPILRPRMSTLARVASGSAASWFYLCIGFAIQVLLVPVFLSHWTPREYGVWIGIGAAGPLIQFLDLGHHNYIGSEALRLGTQSRDELSTLYGSAVRVALMASVVELALVVGLVWSGVLGHLLGEQTAGDPLLRDAGLILILQSTVWLIQGNWSSIAIRVLLPFGYFPHVAWFQASVAVATAIAQAVALTLGAKLLAVGVAYHGMFVVCSWLGTFYIRRVITKERLSTSHSSFAFGMVNYARSVVLSVRGVLEKLRQEQFRLIIAPLVGPSALVLFMTTRTIANVVIAGLGTIAIPLTPELARYLSVRDAAKSASVISVVWLVLIGVLAPATVAAPFLIEPAFIAWTRGQLKFDGVLFALFSAGVLLFAFAQPTISVLQSLNRVVLQVVTSSVATTAALIGTWIFVPAMGVRGAAGSLLAGELIVCGCSVFALRRTFKSLGMEWPHSQLLITAASVGVSCLLIGFASVPGSRPTLIVPAAIAVAVVGSVALLASLPDSTRLMMRSWARSTT
jgi:O-antigen/teichoic acid export membrane protein